MSLPPFPLGNSRVVSGRYPPPGTDPIADAIRERRGARGITPLDAALLHAPPIASGFNTLLGAIRTKGKLPGDTREAMILRVAALNGAAFEWIHHETIGRNEGLTTGQLFIIRDTDTPLLSSGHSLLTPLQTAVIRLTDHSTGKAQVPFDVIEEVKDRLKEWYLTKEPSLDDDSISSKVEDLYVEAAMVIATYNMVSRFLLSADVAGMSDRPVPWPVTRSEHFIELPSYSSGREGNHLVHAITFTVDEASPWLVFSNSLMTDYTMWNYLLPYLLDLPAKYNILLHSQRGHGRSSLPSPTYPEERETTIPLLAQDIANLLDALSIPTPVHSVIGVSQGGATALAFAGLYSTETKTKSIIACDTGPRTAPGNKEAWEERIQLVYGNVSPRNEQYAQVIGMRKLGEVTVPRWFPPGSTCYEESQDWEKKAKWLENMIANTKAEGFVQGARALGEYDLLEADADLFKSAVPKVLLVAGSMDGLGKVGKGLEGLREKWVAAAQPGVDIRYAEIEGSGHLPMVDRPREFAHLIGEWLAGV